MGRENESIARQAYVKYMQRNGQINLIVRECGFIIHPEKGWLGSSPDGVVLDTADESCAGLLELKCPYTKRDVLPQEACQDANFYCCLSDDGSITLNKYNYSCKSHLTCTSGVTSAYTQQKVY